MITPFRYWPAQVVLSVLCLACVGSAGAATFTVTTTSDSGAGSLRQAILDANATIDADFINFAIPGTGPHKIMPVTPLPATTNPVSINALVQPGANCFIWPPSLQVELDGSLAPGGTNGLVISGGASAVRGFIINGFGEGAGILINSNANVVECNILGTDSTGTSGSVALSNEFGVVVDGGNVNVIGCTRLDARNLISNNQEDGVRLRNGATGNTVAGNFIGTDVTGSASLPNGNSGVYILGAPGNTVGGAGRDTGVCNSSCNLISGNADNGVEVFNTGGNNTVIQGNFIGTDISGTAAVPNGINGIRVDGNAHLIGGTIPDLANLISGNAGNGLALQGDGALVRGNFIGTDVTGSAALGNIGAGILIAANGNTVGGTGAGVRNTIAHNGHGVIVNNGGVSNPILRNVMYTNTGLGIDLNGNGVTANDPGDADTGANRLQNFPVIASVTGENGVTLTISYHVPSATVNSAYPLTVEFFLADADGEEGQTFIGSDTYSVGEAQQQVLANFTPASEVVNGNLILATATDANGNTSEFSASVASSGGGVSDTIFADGFEQAPLGGASSAMSDLVEDWPENGLRAPCSPEVNGGS